MKLKNAALAGAIAAVIGVTGCAASVPDATVRTTDRVSNYISRTINRADRGTGYGTRSAATTKPVTVRSTSYDGRYANNSNAVYRGGNDHRNVSVPNNGYGMNRANATGTLTNRGSVTNPNATSGYYHNGLAANMNRAVNYGALGTANTVNRVTNANPAVPKVTATAPEASVSPASKAQVNTTAGNAANTTAKAPVKQTVAQAPLTSENNKTTTNTTANNTTAINKTTATTPNTATTRNNTAAAARPRTASDTTDVIVNRTPDLTAADLENYTGPKLVKTGITNDPNFIANRGLFNTAPLTTSARLGARANQPFVSANEANFLGRPVPRAASGRTRNANGARGMDINNPGTDRQAARIQNADTLNYRNSMRDDTMPGTLDRFSDSARVMPVSR